MATLLVIQETLALVELSKIILATGPVTSLVIVVYSPTSAQSYVIFYGLQKAWEDGFRHIVCESDSKLVLHPFQNAINEYHHYYPLIQLIYDLIGLEWTIIFKHNLCEGNACADQLAKYITTPED